MQIKQMLFPMMSMVLSIAPCSHLHAQGQTPVSQMEKLDRGLVALLPRTRESSSVGDCWVRIANTYASMWRGMERLSPIR